MHIDIPRAQLLIEERDTMETVGKHAASTGDTIMHDGAQAKFVSAAVSKMTGPLCY